METIGILEAVCFPKGCRIGKEDQLMLATVIVPKLKESGMIVAEWTRGAALLEEPHLSKVKSIVCRGCGHTSCQHNNSKYSPIANDPLSTAFHISYGERIDFNQDVLRQLLPEKEVRELEKCGLKVFKWMSSSRNQIHITIKIGEQSIRYSSDLRRQQFDLTVNNKVQPTSTSITCIRNAVKSIAGGVEA